jgi:hypothetical protein
VNFGYPGKCFFTVGQSASGTWWFIDPSGKPFITLGVTSVSYWGDISSTGAHHPHLGIPCPPHLFFDLFDGSNRSLALLQRCVSKVWQPGCMGKLGCGALGVVESQHSWSVG